MILTTKLNIDATDFSKGITQSINEGKKLGDAIKQNLSNIKIGIDDKPATGAFQNLENIAQKASTNMKGMFEKAFNFSNIVNSVNLIADSMNQVVSVGVEFESSLAAVGAITGFTGDGLANIGQKARELAVAFGGSATDQLKSFQGILSKLGPDIAKDADALALFGKNVNLLSAASGDDAATSMNAITDAMLQLGLATGTPMEQAAKSTDVINALAASAKVGAAEIPQVAQALVVAGVAAKGANLDLVDTNAAIQVLALGGKTGAEAGTALRNVLGLLQKASGPAASALTQLGTSSEELGQLLTTQGLDAALQKVKVGMNGLGTDAERNAALMQIFGMENAAAAGILLDNTSKFAEFSDGIRAGMQGVGDATIQANLRLDTAGAKIERLKARVSDVFISITQTIGQGFTTMLGAFSQLAPMLAGLSGLKMLVPDGLLTNVKQLALTLISKLVPSLVVSDVATKSLVLNKQALSLANIKEAATNALSIAGKYAAAVATGALALATGGATAAAGAFNAVLLANPIGLIVLAIAALVGGIYLLYKNFESVRKAVDFAFAVFKGLAIVVWDVVSFFVKLHIELYKLAGLAIWTILKAAFNAVIDGIKTVVDYFGRLASAVTDKLASAFNRLSVIFQNAYSYVAPFVDFFINPIIDGFTWIYDKIALVVDKVVGFAKSVGSAVGGAIDFLAKIGGATDESDKKQDKSLANSKKRNKEKENLNKNAIKWTLAESKAINEAKKITDDLTAGTIDRSEALARLSKNSGALTAEQKTLANDKENLAKLNTEYAKYEQIIKKKDGTAKTSAKVSRDAFEIAKDQFELDKDLAKQKQTQAELARQNAILDAGRIETSIEKKNAELDILAKENVELNRQKLAIADLVKATDSITDKDKKAKYIADVAKMMSDLDTQITTNIVKRKELVIEVNTDRDQVNEEIAKINNDKNKNKLEFDVSIGKANKSELIQFEINEYQSEIDKAQNELTAQINLGVNADGKAIAEHQLKMQNANIEIAKKQDELNKQLELERIGKIQDSVKRETALRLLAEKESYNEELRLAGSNDALKLQALRKYTLARAAILRESTLKSASFDTSVLTSLANNVQNALSNMTINTNDQDQQRAKERLETIKGEMDGLEKSYISGGISYQDYMTKLNALDKERAVAQKEASKSTLDIQKSLNDALKESFGALAETSKASVAVSTEEINAIGLAIADVQSKIKESTNLDELAGLFSELDSLNQASGDAMTAVWQNVGVIVGGVFGQMLASGNSFIKSSVLAALAGLKAIAGILVAEILGKEFVRSGPAGIITGGILTGLFMAAISAAEAGVKKLKFAKGGLNPYGGFGSGLLKNEKTITAGEGGESEYIVNHKSSMSNLKLLEHINSGKSGADFYKKELTKLIDYKTIIGNFQTLDRRLSNIEYENYRANNADLVKGLNGMSNELVEIKRAIKSQKIESYSNYNVDVKNNVVTAAKVALNRG